MYHESHPDHCHNNNDGTSDNSPSPLPSILCGSRRSTLWGWKLSDKNFSELHHHLFNVFSRQCCQASGCFQLFGTSPYPCTGPGWFRFMIAIMMILYYIYRWWGKYLFLFRVRSYFTRKDLVLIIGSKTPQWCFCQCLWGSLLAPSGALVFFMVYYIHTKATFSNSSDSKVLEGPNMCYIFERA